MTNERIMIINNIMIDTDVLYKVETTNRYE